MTLKNYIISKHLVSIVLVICIAFNLSLTQSNAKSLSEQTHLAAKQWYQNNNLKIDQITASPAQEIAIYLNKAVYAHCVNGANITPMDELFQNCQTTCFGYAYVLRGLLEAIGYQTRFVHLHNIPQQGNHTAMEVLINGKWRFFDPTFGVYFTEDGLADGDILSLNDIVKNDLPSLSKKVLATQKTKPQLSTSIKELYNAPYKQPFMDLHNYLLAEKVIYEDGETEYLTLDIPLTLDDDYAQFGVDNLGDINELEQKWLKITNARLLDNDLLNDTSFNTSYLSPAPKVKTTTLSLFNLTPHKKYKLKFLFYHYYDDGRIEITQIGKSVKNLMLDPISQTKGAHFYEGTIIPYRQTAVLQIRQTKTNQLSRLFGVEIQAD